MSLINSLKKLFGTAADAVKTAEQHKKKTVKFESLPLSVEDLQAHAEGGLTDEFGSAALCVAALAAYPEHPDECLAMLEFLNGPENVVPSDKQFLRDRFDGKPYLMRSYFAGATPSNDYTPSKPYSVTVSANPYSYQNENYCTLFVQSGGADSPRQIDLRYKPSTKQWFIRGYNGLLGGIRIPTSEDKWA